MNWSLYKDKEIQKQTTDLFHDHSYLGQLRGREGIQAFKIELIDSEAQLLILGRVMSSGLFLVLESKDCHILLYSLVLNYQQFCFNKCILCGI